MQDSRRLKKGTMIYDCVFLMVRPLQLIWRSIAQRLMENIILLQEPEWALDCYH